MSIVARAFGRDVEIWGRNAVVGTSFEELYAYDQSLSWPAILPTAFAMDISSSSVEDGLLVDKGAATMTIAAPCVVTLSTHGLVTGDAVKFTTTGALPTGLVASAIYYAIRVDANTFNLATTLANALAGTKITTTGSQSGTHTLFGPRTGARKLIIFGIDGNYALQQETVSLAGQTVVTTSKTFLRVFGATCTEAGSGLVNAGDIHIVKTGTGGSYTTGVPGTLTSAICKILAGYGVSENGLFTVPAGKIARLKGLLLTARAQACTFQLLTQELGGTTNNSLHVDFPVEVAVNSTSYVSAADIGMVHEWKEKTDIRMRVLAAGASGIASGMMLLEVVDK